MTTDRSPFSIAAFAISLIAGVLACSVASVAADEPVPDHGLCFRCRAYPECRAFFITNSGLYYQLGARAGATPARAIVDWGAMVNLSPRNAIGASWFISAAENELSTGPVLRWRQWLGTTQSIDVAIGTPIAGGNLLRPGSVLGLVKYNPVYWLGVAARPELARFHDEYVCDEAGCRALSGTKTRLSLGAEVGELPGFLLGTAAGVTAGAVLLAFLAHNN